jgi:hypothetical protein
MRILRLTGLVVVLLAESWAQGIYGAPVQEGLALSARIQSSRAGLVEVQVTIRNVSERDFVVQLGEVVGSKAYPASGLKFTFRDAEGKTYDVVYVGAPGVIGGTIGPNLVSLTAHGTYSFEVPVETLLLLPAYEPAAKRFGPGASLTIALTGKSSLAPGEAVRHNLPLWVGTAEVSILFDRPQAATKADAPPRDGDQAVAMLERYARQSPDMDADRSRLRVIDWILENQPDTCVQEARILFVNPQAAEDYAAVRPKWLRLVEQHGDKACLLRNAAVALRLTDRAPAAEWLKRAIALAAGNKGAFYTLDLAQLYADALTGVTAEDVRGVPLGVDRAVAESDFAKQAFADATKDAELAARVGWQVHLNSASFRYDKLTPDNYDAVAERLLLRSAELQYPEPARYPFLDQFYRSQNRVASQAPVVRVPAEEQAKNLVRNPVFHVPQIAAPVSIPVDVVVGVDGHIWEVKAKQAPSTRLADFAEGAAREYVYRPLLINGAPVRVSTTVEVTLTPSNAP